MLLFTTGTTFGERKASMIDFYNAFISYKHGPLDSKIASHIQRKLEHFHVPHKLGKKLKHKKITQIFRDKDELPITSDLTETITNALEKAEYLIVICSTHTRESFWVKREINTFLKTHSQDKILTVLTEGEPFEVIPEELLTQVKEYTDENGFMQRVKVPVEPLSCDYRMRTSQADKEELPRLAAALLGCSYDELLRRRRQYRIRRAAAIIGVAFAAVVAFGCYMAYTGKKINDSYIESLRSKSLYLANESEQLLAEGKRVDAIQLALAALPGDEKSKMPETGAAVRAITDATSAYRSNSGASYTPIWNYKTEHPVSKGILSEDDLYLAAMDQSGNTYCWDTSSKKLIFEKVGEDDPKDILFLGKESILIMHSYNIEAYNIQTGTLIWEYEAPDRTPIRDGDVLYANHAVFFDNGNGEVVRLSAKDGSVKDTYKVLNDMFLTSIDCLAVSSDGKKLAFTDSALSFGSVNIHIFDTETLKDYTAELETMFIVKISFADDDHLCVIANNDMFNSSISFSEDLTYIQSGYMQMYCYNSSNAKLAWETELEYTDVLSTTNTLYLPARKAVLFYAGNAAAIYNIGTGEKINDYLTGSSIVSAADFNKNDLPEFICRHGEYVFTLNEDSNDLGSYSVLCNNVIVGLISDFIYACPSGGNDIICYYRYLQDDEWTEIDCYGGFTTGSSYQVSYAEDDLLIIAARVTDTYDVRVSFIDLNSGKLLSSTDVHDINYLTSNFCIERVGDDIYGYFGNNIVKIDPENETVRMVDIELDTLDTVSNGKIITYNILGSDLKIEVYDIDGTNYKEMSLEDVEDISIAYAYEPVYIEQADSVFLPIGRRVFVANLEKQRIKEMKVPDNWIVYNRNDFNMTASDDGSLILLSDSNTILVTDDSLKELYTIRCYCKNRFNAIFRNNILYVIADDSLFLYDSKTGELIGRHDITEYGIGTAELIFDEKNHQLFVRVGDQVSVFDTDSWVEIAFVENAYCYHKETERFYVYSYLVSTDCMTGYIRHYTTAELIEKANKLLDGQELSEETRSRYGL